MLTILSKGEGQIKMTNNQKPNNFDLEERTLKFAKNVMALCRKLVRNDINRQLVTQLIRAATSIGANYREANDSLGKKDFAHRVRIARKETKETIYWLELLLDNNPQHKEEIDFLLKESIELRNILSAIIKKVAI